MMEDKTSLLKSIHYFWFGSLDEELPAQAVIRKWFGSNPEVDKEIEQKYTSTIEQAVDGELNDWRENAQGSIVLVILFDQFPRNIFRRTERAFAYDDLAVQLAQETVEKGFDKRMHFVERIFCYLPFTHQEDEAMQHKGVALFQQLVNQASGEQYEFGVGSLKIAREHLSIISRFGRFPHRNEALGRVSNEEEIKFLANQANRYGQ